MNAKVLKNKVANRLKRKRRIRAKISGCASLPRVSVFRSNRYLSVQAIDDVTATTLCALHSKVTGHRANKEGAAALGEAFATKLKEANPKASFTNIMRADALQGLNGLHFRQDSTTGTYIVMRSTREVKLNSELH